MFVFMLLATREKRSAINICLSLFWWEKIFIFSQKRFHFLRNVAKFSAGKKLSHVHACVFRFNYYSWWQKKDEKNVYIELCERLHRTSFQFLIGGYMRTDSPSSATDILIINSISSWKFDIFLFKNLWRFQRVRSDASNGSKHQIHSLKPIFAYNLELMHFCVFEVFQDNSYQEFFASSDGDWFCRIQNVIRNTLDLSYLTNNMKSFSIQIRALSRHIKLNGWKFEKSIKFLEKLYNQK